MFDEPFSVFIDLMRNWIGICKQGIGDTFEGSDISVDIVYILSINN